MVKAIAAVRRGTARRRREPQAAWRRRPRV